MSGGGTTSETAERVPVGVEPPDAEVEHEAHELRRALALAARRVRAERGAADLPDPQFNVLVLLARHGVMTPGQLAERERVQPPSMTRTITVLAGRGLVAKQENPADGRKVLVELTPAGRTEVTETKRRRDAWLAGRLAGLSAGDRACLAQAVALLDRIAQS